jgi:hypothetical protein
MEREQEFRRFCKNLEDVKKETAFRKTSSEFTEKLLASLPSIYPTRPKKLNVWNIFWPTLVGTAALAGGWLVMNNLSVLSRHANHPSLGEEQRVTTQLVSLWKEEGLTDTWWQPVLKKAQQQGRVRDVWTVCRRARQMNLSPHRVMIVLETGLSSNRPTGAILTEAKTMEEIAADVTPLHEARVENAKLPPGEFSPSTTTR